MTYVMSDIHGNQARFEDVMRKINLQPEDTLYILGDVIDRFPDGIKMIRQFMKMPNVKMLLGNHEHMMLEALYYPIVVKKPTTPLWS
jgi:serine/threonine protein phosphatase 1